MNTEKFLNKLEMFLDSNKGLSCYLDKNYKLYLQELKSLSSTNKSLIQLHWFITQIASETSLSSVSALTLNTFFEILKPSACSLYLVKNDNQIIEVDSINKDICIDCNNCNFINNIINNKKSNIKDKICSNKKSLCSFNYSLSYPLYKRDGNILGYLVAFFDNKNKTIQKETQLFMDIFYVQIGLSLENVLLEEKMTTLAFTDELTGLANKRMLFKQIKLEIKKYDALSIKSNGIGCIMIDIDNFKNYNDSFGHIAGDFVIQHLGEVILSNISKNDVGARYGGEEMCIVLPNKTLDETIEVAELIRKQIEETIFEFREVTISLGVSHYPTNVSSQSFEIPSDIIQYADTCLYHSKNTGKNKVTSSYNIVKTT